jgi:plasmid stabilization system protein ParE
VRVVWTKAADSNLQAIYDYIAQTSADYARRTVERITDRSRQISAFPMAGRTVPEFQVGQLREVFENPYRIIYRIRPDRVDVVAVVHMSRLLDTSNPPQIN